MLTGPRVAFAMARAGHFPAIAGRLSAGSRAPAVATSLQVAWAVLLLWTGSFESIVIYAGVGLAMFSMLAVGSIYVLRRARPDLPRPFRTPGYPLVPAVFLAGTALLTVAAFLERALSPSLRCSASWQVCRFTYLWVRPRSRMARGRTQNPHVVSHSHLTTIDCGCSSSVSAWIVPLRGKGPEHFVRP